MHRYTRTAIALSACLALLGCGHDDDNQSPPARLKVVATIFPLADVVGQVAGDRVTVHCLLSPGQSPHEFSPQAAQLEQLSGADLLVRVGLGMDAWAQRAVATAGRGKTRVLTLAEDPNFQRMLAQQGGDANQRDHEDEDEHEHEHAHGHDDIGDPHVWLDPVFMQQFVGQVAAALSQMDPEDAAGYRQRADAYLAKLADLDRLYAQKLQPLTNRRFVTFHPAFTYVARRYGLEQRSLTSPEAEDFGPGAMEEMARYIRDNHVRAILAEPQFPTERLDVLARQSGAHVGVLDPLGEPGSRGYDSYLALMRSNLDSLVRALGE